MAGSLKGRPRFKRTLNKTDMGLTATTLSTTQFLQIMAYTVPAQQVLAWGNNEVTNGGVQGAVAYIDMQTVAPADIDGVIRLSITDASGFQKFVIVEERSEKFRASQYDRTQGVLLPESDIKAKQDSILLVEMLGDAADLINIAASTVLLPVTVYV